jgi:hypothetical protein
MIIASKYVSRGGEHHVTSSNSSMTLLIFIPF